MYRKTCGRSSLACILLGLAATSCAVDIEPHQFEASVRCEVESDERWMTTDVFAHFEEGKLRRKESKIEPDSMAATEGAALFAFGTRREGITRYELRFSAEALMTAQRFSDDPIDFSGAVSCVIPVDDVAQHPDFAEPVECDASDASCTVRAFTEYPSGAWIQL